MSANGINTERLVADMKLVMRDAEDLSDASADLGINTHAGRIVIPR